MSIWIAMANAGTAAADAAAKATPNFAPASLPEWIQIALALIGVGVLIAVATTLSDLRSRFAPIVDRNADFAKMLAEGVARHSERLDREFAEVLRVPPQGLANTQAYVRDLRRLLREAVAFVRHMRTYALGDWPSFALADRFSDWAAIIDSIDSLLADMFVELNAAVTRDRWGELIEQYRREEWYVRRDLEKLGERAKAVESAAKPFRKKPKRHHDDDEHDDHH